LWSSRWKNIFILPSSDVFVSSRAYNSFDYIVSIVYFDWSPSVWGLDRFHIDLCEIEPKATLDSEVQFCLNQLHMFVFDLKKSSKHSLVIT
jgi:hypothetical protein